MENPAPEVKPACDPGPEAPLPRTSAQRTLAIVILALAVGAFLYEIFMQHGVWQTAAMFIGIPAALSIILALAPRPRSATGSILRGMAIALLLIAPLLGEGYLCILMASPLFFAVGLIIGIAIDRSRARRNATLSCIVLVVLPMSLEGIVPQLTHNRAQTATVTRTINAPVTQVEAALAQSPDITTPLPYFLRIGFPRPLAVHGSGLTPNSERTIHFAGAEGDPPGDLVMRVEEARPATSTQPGYVRFRTTADSSKLTQWVAWRSSEVTYAPIDVTHTRVTWSIHFDRRLDPWWYFAPWEQLAAHDATKYLILANATPHQH